MGTFSAWVYRGSFGAMALLFTSISSAQTCTYFDNFKDNGNGTITDPRDGLVWQRCSVGQVWSGTGCKKNAKELTWEQAMRTAKKDRFIGKPDWRLPTKKELRAVVGDYSNCQYPNRRASSSLFALVNPDADPTEQFQGNIWSTTPVSNSATASWDISFSSGYVDEGSRDLMINAKLVRAGDIGGLSEFNIEFGKISQHASDLSASKNNAAKIASPSMVTYREGDNVCVMQWQSTGFCGNVDRVSGDRLKVEITRITCGGWVGQCSADPCSGGVSVGQSAQAKVKDFVWTEKYCVTSR